MASECLSVGEPEDREKKHYVTCASKKIRFSFHFSKFSNIAPFKKERKEKRYKKIMRPDAEFNYSRDINKITALLLETKNQKINAPPISTFSVIFSSFGRDEDFEG